MTLPYENATSGAAAYESIQKILTVFGCSSFGMMNNYEQGFTLIQFTHRDRTIELRASWKGYASAWLKQNPWSHRMHSTQEQHRAKALDKGKMAAPSILRDWVKAQITAIEIGLMPFEEAFMPQMLLSDGRRLVDAARQHFLAIEPPKGTDDAG